MKANKNYLLTNMKLKQDHMWEHISKTAVEPRFFVVVY